MLLWRNHRSRGKRTL